MSTIDQLNWRYAVKRYDATKKLSDEQRNIIMEALRLSPSSFGPQPWKFVHVTTPAVREQLRAAAWGQPQLTDASDVFVLCSLIGMDEAYVDKFVASVAKTRGQSVEELAGLKGAILGSITTKSVEELSEWNARQVYIALGVAIAAAAENQIDANPMEGFDKAKFDEILGLKEMGYQSRVILCAGFRSPEDPYIALKKSRFTQEEVFIQK